MSKQMINYFKLLTYVSTHRKCLSRYFKYFMNKLNFLIDIGSLFIYKVY